MVAEHRKPLLTVISYIPSVYTPHTAKSSFQNGWGC